MEKSFTSTYTLSQIAEGASELLHHFPDHKIFVFNGELGSGKTTLIKSLCEQLAVQDDVASPTFAIVSVYHSVDHGAVNHIDCYRLKNVEEALSIGMDDYLYNNQYCFIEWPQVILPLLPDQYVSIDIETEKDERRRLTAKEICKNNTNQK